MSRAEARRGAAGEPAGAGPKATAPAATPKHGAQVVNFGEVRRSEWNSENIQALVGQTFVIVGVEWAQGARGDVAIITTADGKRYHTFSAVVQKQLKDMSDVLAQGFAVRATLRRVKSPKGTYLTLE